MRSSIFLVVPFAAVALGQVVRFSTLLPPLPSTLPQVFDALYRQNLLKDLNSPLLSP